MAFRKGVINYSRELLGERFEEIEKQKNLKLSQKYNYELHRELIKKTHETRRLMPNYGFTEKGLEAIRKSASENTKGCTPWNKLSKEVRQCKRCGVSFEVLPASSRKYCSRSCYWFRPKRICLNCGKETKNKQFCSNKCHSQFADIGHKQGFKKGLMSVNYGESKAAFIINARSEKIRIKWKNDPEYVRKVMARREMSGPEILFQKIIDENNFPFTFTGTISNRTVVIGGKVPDFTHKIEKKVIEIYGDFFHKGQNPQDRIDFFKGHGYDCLVLWASELAVKNRDIVKCKVNNFTGGK